MRKPQVKSVSDELLPTSAIFPLRVEKLRLSGLGSYHGEAELRMAPLTLLCGINGSGKSTWIRALKEFLKAIRFKADESDIFHQHGFNDLVNIHKRSSGIPIMQGSIFFELCCVVTREHSFGATSEIPDLKRGQSAREKKRYIGDEVLRDLIFDGRLVTGTELSVRIENGEDPYPREWNEIVSVNGKIVDESKSRVASFRISQISELLIECIDFIGDLRGTEGISGNRNDPNSLAIVSAITRRGDERKQDMVNNPAHFLESVSHMPLISVIECGRSPVRFEDYMPMSHKTLSIAGKLFMMKNVSEPHLIDLLDLLGEEDCCDIKWLVKTLSQTCLPRDAAIELKNSLNNSPFSASTQVRDFLLKDINKAEFEYRGRKEWLGRIAQSRMKKLQKRFDVYEIARRDEYFSGDIDFDDLPFLLIGMALYTGGLSNRDCFLKRYSLLQDPDPHLWACHGLSVLENGVQLSFMLDEECLRGDSLSVSFLNEAECRTSCVPSGVIEELSELTGLIKSGRPIPGFELRLVRRVIDSMLGVDWFSFSSSPIGGFRYWNDAAGMTLASYCDYWMFHCLKIPVLNGSWAGKNRAGSSQTTLLGKGPPPDLQVFPLVPLEVASNRSVVPTIGFPSQSTWQSIEEVSGAKEQDRLAQNQQGRYANSPLHHSTAFFQILPLFLMGGLKEKYALMCIENPEVHLHAGLQRKIMEYFISLANAGKCVIIETHSDLMVRRLLRAILAEEIGQAKINIVFCRLLQVRLIRFQTEGDEELRKPDIVINTSVAEEIKVNSLGRVVDWPEGFLDDDIDESLLFAELLNNSEDEE